MEFEDVATVELHEGDIIFPRDLFYGDFPHHFFFAPNAGLEFDNKLIPVKDKRGELHYLHVDDVNVVSTLAAMWQH